MMIQVDEAKLREILEEYSQYSCGPLMLCFDYPLEKGATTCRYLSCDSADDVGCVNRLIEKLGEERG